MKLELARSSGDDEVECERREEGTTAWLRRGDDESGEHNEAVQLLLLGLACRSFSLASQHRSTAQGTAKVAARISTVVSIVQTALVLLLARATTTTAARPASPPSDAHVPSSQAHRRTRREMTASNADRP